MPVSVNNTLNAAVQCVKCYCITSIASRCMLPSRGWGSLPTECVCQGTLNITTVVCLYINCQINNQSCLHYALLIAMEVKTNKLKQ